MSAIRPFFISALKPDGSSTHLKEEGSGKCSQTSCRLFFRSRRQSFDTIGKFSPRKDCKVPGLVEQRVSSFPVAG